MAFVLLLFLSTLAIRTVAYDFTPRHGSIMSNYTNEVPVYYDITQTQLIDHKPNNSYYINAFIHGSNNHDYLVISHAITNQTTPDVTLSGFYRASMFDITAGFYTSWFVPEFYSGLPVTALNISFDQFSFAAISSDDISTIHTSSTNGSSGFDFTIQAMSPVLYNFAAGVFAFGTGLQYEWGIPSNSIQGSITVNGSKIEIDSQQSFAWYDRQSGPGTPSTGNWTWFEMHFGHTGIKASAWQIDNAMPYQKTRSATLLKPNGVHEVSAVEFTSKYERTYVSPVTGITYPLDWELKWPSGDIVHISSVYADQELIGPAKPFTAYEGFVTLNGTIDGHHFQGYGLVEMVRFVGT